jgi:hypothetical protein
MTFTDVSRYTAQQTVVRHILNFSLIYRRRRGCSNSSTAYPTLLP